MFLGISDERDVAVRGRNHKVYAYIERWVCLLADEILFHTQYLHRSEFSTTFTHAPPFNTPLIKSS